MRTMKTLSVILVLIVTVRAQAQAVVPVPAVVSDAADSANARVMQLQAQIIAKTAEIEQQTAKVARLALAVTDLKSVTHDRKASLAAVEGDSKAYHAAKAAIKKLLDEKDRLAAQRQVAYAALQTTPADPALKIVFDKADAAYIVAGAAAMEGVKKHQITLDGIALKYRDDVAALGLSPSSDFIDLLKMLSVEVQKEVDKAVEAERIQHGLLQQAETMLKSLEAECVALKQQLGTEQQEAAQAVTNVTAHVAVQTGTDLAAKMLQESERQTKLLAQIASSMATQASVKALEKAVTGQTTILRGVQANTAAQVLETKALRADMGVLIGLSKEICDRVAAIDGLTVNLSEQDRKAVNVIVGSINELVVSEGKSQASQDAANKRLEQLQRKLEQVLTSPTPVPVTPTMQYQAPASAPNMNPACNWSYDRRTGTYYQVCPVR